MFRLVVVASALFATEALPAAEVADEPTSRRIGELIEKLRQTKIDEPGPWCAAIRELTEIGKPAVPALIGELDQTTDQRALRSLGFTLRAIGDPRAVPSLIRAIPRTFVFAGSDFGGLQAGDAATTEFMRQHDLDKKDRGDGFSFGVPFREVTGALKSLTGHDFSEGELNFVTPGLGGAEQERLQVWLFEWLAFQWAGWWEENSHRFTDDPAYAKVGVDPIGAPPLPPNAERFRPGRWSRQVKRGAVSPLGRLRRLSTCGRFVIWIPAEKPVGRKNSLSRMQPRTRRARPLPLGRSRSGWTCKGSSTRTP